MFKTLKTFNITYRKIQKKNVNRVTQLKFCLKKNTRKNNHNINYDTIMGVGKYLRIYS